MNQIWFTSDTHFYHKNIIKYCNRPYESVEEMNAAMIENWNQHVKPADTIYHLGDFIFAGKKKARDIISQLNGNKVLIRGNHDAHIKTSHWMDLGFDMCFENLTLFSELHQIKFGMFHMPDVTFGKDEDYVLCGHVHDKWKRNGKFINVGVDVWDMVPVNLDELVEFIKSEEE